MDEDFGSANYAPSKIKRARKKPQDFSVMKGTSKDDGKRTSKGRKYSKFKTDSKYDFDETLLSTGSQPSKKKLTAANKSGAHSVPRDSTSRPVTETTGFCVIV